jgi:S-adenosylmethionine decarboxylase
MGGIEWIVDAHGCDPAALRDLDRLGRLMDRLVEVLALTPVAPPAWHTFPSTGGVTGFVMLAESHLACHTFPEFGSICLNVFCCRPRPDWNARELLQRALGATDVQVRRIERTYAAVPQAGSVAEA